LIRLTQYYTQSGFVHQPIIQNYSKLGRSRNVKEKTEKHKGTVVLLTSVDRMHFLFVT